jgi:NAD kinase
MLFDRTLVLDADTVVDILAGRDRRAILEVDGRVVADVEPGDRVRCTASPHVARVVSFGPRDFHRILKAKFGLSDR